MRSHVIRAEGRPGRRARSSRPAACACTTCAPARAGRSSTCTEPRAPSTTSPCRSARASRERYAAVAMDRPGSGFSGRPATGENSPQAQAAVLRAAAAELGLERPLLVGHSFGAAVALAWALDAPDDVAAVVTLGGYVLPLGRTAAVGGRAAAQPDRASRRGRPRPLPPGPPARRERREAGLLPRHAAARVPAHRAAARARDRQPDRRRRGPQGGRGGPRGPARRATRASPCRW